MAPRPGVGQFKKKMPKRRPIYPNASGAAKNLLI
jgi:hypothetical protein